MSHPFTPADHAVQWGSLIDTQCVLWWCIIPSDVCLHQSQLTSSKIHRVYNMTSRTILIQSTHVLYLLFLSHSFQYSRWSTQSHIYTMFKSILTFTLISLSLTSVSAAPMPMNFRLARRDGGSAYSGVGGEANGGNVNKYNRLVHFFSIFSFFVSSCQDVRWKEKLKRKWSCEPQHPKHWIWKCREWRGCFFWQCRWRIGMWYRQQRRICLYR